MEQRNAGGEQRRRSAYDGGYGDAYDSGADDHYGRGYADTYDDSYDERDRRPRTATAPPARAGQSKAGKPKALIATSIALVVFAAGATAVVASGVLTKKNDKSPTATNPAPGVSRSASAPPSAAPSSAASALYSDQVPTVSDGTNVVRVNHREVKFPSTVTGAVWSPNGTRLAYLDGDGNVATALADGTDVRVLTKKKAGIQRGNVAWDGTGTTLYWDSRTGSGRWLIAQAGVGDAPAVESDLRSWASDEGDKNPNSEVSSSAVRADAIGVNPDSIIAFRIGDVVFKSDYIRAKLDPDTSGYGGYGFSDAAKGSDPDLAPDGGVVYVGVDGQVHIAGGALNPQGPPLQITFGADHPSHPKWSPDGKRVAFGTRTDVESVSTEVHPGATANPARQEDPKPGVPAYQPIALSPAVLALDGADPISAAVTVSQATWTDYRSAMKTSVRGTTGAVLVPADAPTPVLNAAALFAATQSVPVFPVTDGALDPRATGELTRLFGQHDKRKFLIGYAGSTVPAGVASTVTAATGSAPLPIAFHDAYDFGSQAAQAFFQQGQKDNSGAGGPDPRQPAQVTLVVADDDRPGLLVALGAEQSYGTARAEFGSVSVRVVLTKGSTMPDAAKPILNAAKDAQVVAVGAHGAAALAGSWTGKPALQVTKFTGASPAALADATAKGMPAVVKAAASIAVPAPPAVTVLPAPTDAAWIGDLLLAAGSAGPVLFSDSSSALDSAALAYLKPNLSALIHIVTYGDGTALAANLGKALNTPVPFPVLTDPKAPAASGN